MASGANAPMYPTNTERTNYARLCRAIVDLCTQVLRDVLNRYIAPPSNLRHQANSHKGKLTKLNASQWKVINNAPNKGYTEFDITLLYALLRNLGPSSIVPSHGWGAPTSNVCTNIGDDVERIRVVRNTVYGHVVNTAIHTSEFKQHWQVIADVMVRMDTALGATCSQQLQFIEMDCMDIDTEQKYIQQLEELEKRDKDIQEEIDKLKKDIIKHKDDTKEEVDKLKNESSRQKDELAKMSKQNEQQIKKIESSVKIQETHTKEIKKLEDEQKALKIADTPKNRRDMIKKHIEEMIENHRKDTVYVRTEAAYKGLKILEDLNILIYTGLSGDGKTKNALEVMKQMNDKHPKWTFMELDKPRDWRDLVDTDENSVILLDDCLGSISSDGDPHTNDDKIWRHIKSSVDGGNVKVIMTVRKNILDAQINDLEKFEIFSEEHIIDLTAKKFKLSASEKRQILEQHFENNNIEIVQDENENYATDEKDKKLRINALTIYRILATDPLVGFPQTCFLFSSDRKYTRLGVKFFKNPTKGLINELDRMREHEAKETEKIQYCIMSYMVLKSGVFAMNSLDTQMFEQVVESVELQKIPNMGKIEKALENITGRYIIKKDEYEEFEFKHQTIMEGIAVSFGRFSPTILLKHCNSQIIKEIVRLNNYKELTGETVLKLRQSNYENLAHRCLTSLKCMDILDCRRNYTILDLENLEHLFNADEKFDNCFLDIFHRDFENQDVTKETLFRWACKYGLTYIIKKEWNKDELTSETLSRGFVDAVCYDKNEIVFHILENEDNKLQSTEISKALGNARADLLLLMLKHPKIELKHLQDMKNLKFHRSDEMINLISLVFSKWPQIDFDCVSKLLLSFISDLYLKHIPDDVRNLPRLLSFLILTEIHKIVEAIQAAKPDLEYDTAVEMCGWACAFGDEESFDMYYRKLKTAESVKNENAKFLHIAAYFGRFDMFLKLVRLGSKVTDRMTSGFGVLHLAMFGYAHRSFLYTYVEKPLADLMFLASRLFSHYCVYFWFSLELNSQCDQFRYFGSNQFSSILGYRNIINYILKQEGVDFQDLKTSLDAKGGNIVHYCSMYNDFDTLKLIHDREPSLTSLKINQMVSCDHLAILNGSSGVLCMLNELPFESSGNSNQKWSIFEIFMLGYVHLSKVYSDTSFSENGKSIFKEYLIVERYDQTKEGVQRNYLQVLKCILGQNYVHPNELELRITQHCNTLAHCCVVCDDFGMIKFLSEYYPSVLSVSNSEFHKPIHLAALLGRSKIFEILYETEDKNYDKTNSLDNQMKVDDTTELMKLVEKGKKYHNTTRTKREMVISFVDGKSYRNDFYCKEKYGSILDYTQIENIITCNTVVDTAVK